MLTRPDKPVTNVMNAYDLNVETWSLPVISPSLAHIQPQLTGHVERSMGIICLSDYSKVMDLFLKI